jgi:hypothetical protein
MLLRIAPQMFLDPHYECVTLNAVYGELRRQRRFKTKYPWLDAYQSKVRGLPKTTQEAGEYKRTLAVVRALFESSRSANDHHRFGLSSVDVEIAATVVAHHYSICTAEHDLEEFLKQDFDVENEAPLKIVNNWIERGLIVWTEAEQRVLEDWITQNERRQPFLEIQRFEKLAKRKYPRG